MDLLLPPLNCTCSTKALFNKRDDESRLFTFLIRLNDNYDATITQIVLIKHLPNLDMAYFMVVQVEDQRQLNEASQDGRNLMYMNVGKQQSYAPQNSSQSQFGNSKQGYHKQGSPSGFFKKRMSKEEKKRFKCSHCQGMRHEVDECFKLHGIPEWYTKYKKNRSQPRAHFAESGVPNENYASQTELKDQKDQTHDVSELI